MSLSEKHLPWLIGLYYHAKGELARSPEQFRRARAQRVADQLAAIRRIDPDALPSETPPTID